MRTIQKTYTNSLISDGWYIWFEDTLYWIDLCGNMLYTRQGYIWGML